MYNYGKQNINKEDSTITSVVKEKIPEITEENMNLV